MSDMTDHMRFNRLLDEDTLSLRDIATDLAAFARAVDDYFEPECRLDHHGYCQEHMLEDPCSVAAVRRVLATLDGIEGYE